MLDRIEAALCTSPVMLANMLVGLWLVLYGRFRIRGAGSLIRLACPFIAKLRAFPLEIPEAGTVLLDFREGVAYDLLSRYKLGQLGRDIGLYRAMEKFCVPGSVLWDVGAFVGYVTAHFAQSRFGLAAIHSFEPNPQNLARLKALFANNSRVTIHPFALGRAEDALELSFSPQSAAMGSLVRESKGGQRVSVRVRAGDVVRNELRIPPDVIKIDVEGFEPEVLAGLSHTIFEKRPIIFFEHIFLSDAQIEQLVPQNYRLFFINDDGNFSEGIASRVKGHDAFLVPAEKLAVVEALMAHNCCCPPLAQVANSTI